MQITRWLWGGRSLSARLARSALVPPAAVYRCLSAARTLAYRYRLLHCGSARVPTIAVGNLTVGGTGKTPIASWIAGYYSRLGLTPGIVLRGYGGDEGDVHRRLVREAVVIESPDRLAGASRAVAEGADVIVLDDAYQRLDIERDLNIAVVSAESGEVSRWTLPAGPWREGWRALRRADLAVVTRKRASSAVAREMLEKVKKVVGECPAAIVHLRVAAFHGMLTGKKVEVAELSGTNILVAAGIADPDTLAAQCRYMGANVLLLRWRDHQKISCGELQEVATLGRDADFTVVTEKDACKIRGFWPSDRDEPLVADLQLDWERGGADVEAALESAIARVQ